METKMEPLQKQWRHWCREAGLKPHYGGRRNNHNWYYLKGHGRVWRLNCFNMLQCGDTLEDFDRWALCSISETERPTSLSGFKETVQSLLKLANEPM